MSDVYVKQASMGKRILQIGLLLVLGIVGWNYFIAGPSEKAEKKRKEKEIIKSLPSDDTAKADPYADYDKPKSYGNTSKRIKTKYGDHSLNIVDSVESDLKAEYKSKLPQAALDAIALKEEPIIVSAIEYRVEEQLRYLRRAIIIDFSVLDTVDKVKLEFNENYRNNFYNNLIIIR